jgi:uncharacterized protein YndB with AHSA1/START domain
MKWLLILAGVLVCVILIVLLIGYLLPVKHRATIALTVHASPNQVWERLTDIRNYPNWRKDVKSVELLSDSEWTEVDPHDHRLPFKIVSRDPDLRLVTRINGQHLPFGGTWEYRIGKGGDGTTVTITEDGEVYNPLFRFVSKFIMGHSATLKRYSTYLESSFK